MPFPYPNPNPFPSDQTGVTDDQQMGGGGGGQDPFGAGGPFAGIPKPTSSLYVISHTLDTDIVTTHANISSSHHIVLQRLLLHTTLSIPTL